MHIGGPARRVALVGILAAFALAGCSDSDNDDSGTRTDASTQNDTGTQTDTGSGLDASDDSGAMALSDPEIAAVSDVANLGEVQQGELAVMRATNEMVRSYAMRMVSEHTMVRQQQMQLLMMAGITPMPNELSMQVQAEAQMVLSMLQATEAPAFDRAYIASQVQMHQRTLMLLDTRLIPNAQNAQFRSFLMMLRGPVSMHLQEAMQMLETLNGDGGVGDGGMGGDGGA